MFAVVNFFRIKNHRKGNKAMQEISSDVIRGYNDTIILYFLLQEPSYGYEISKNIKALSDEKYLIKETTLYSAFTRLEKNGYITSFSQEAENGKRRTYYRITEAGRVYYREKCEEWQLTKDVIERFIE
jgi:PadR family transcriptional regulator PadR